MEMEKVLSQIISLLIIPLLPAVATFIITWFKAKTEEINKNMENQTLKSYIDILNCVVSDVVKSLNQTTVDNLRAAAADGKLTKEEGEKLKNDAVTQVYKIIGSHGIDVLKEVFTDLDSLIANKVEANVHSMKQKK